MKYNNIMEILLYLSNTCMQGFPLQFAYLMINEFPCLKKTDRKLGKNLHKIVFTFPLFLHLVFFQIVMILISSWTAAVAHHVSMNPDRYSMSISMAGNSDSQESRK